MEQKRRGPVGLSGSRTSAAEDRPLLLVVVTLVITLLAGICSPREFAMAVPALVLELGCGVRCVLGLVMDPYGSYRFVYAALAACWLLNILCLV